MPQKAPMTLQQRYSHAVENDHYWKISNGKYSNVKITGAEKAWNEKSAEKAYLRDMMYIPSLRLAGSKDDLSKVLSENGYNSTQVQQFIASAYTRQTAMAGGHLHDAFQNDVKSYKTKHHVVPGTKKVKPEPIFKLSDVPDLFAAIKGSVTTSVSSAARLEGQDAALIEQQQVSGGGKRKGGHKGLAAALASGDLQATEVFNVSASTPGHVKYRKISKPAQGSKLRGVPGLAVVSNSYEAFKAAMDELGPAYAQYTAQYASLNGGATTAAAPAQGELPSLPVVPAPQVATAPVTGLQGLPQLPMMSLPSL